MKYKIQVIYTEVATKKTVQWFIENIEDAEIAAQVAKVIADNNAGSIKLGSIVVVPFVVPPAKPGAPAAAPLP